MFFDLISYKSGCVIPGVFEPKTTTEIGTDKKGGYIDGYITHDGNLVTLPNGLLPSAHRRMKLCLKLIGGQRQFRERLSEIAKIHNIANPEDEFSHFCVMLKFGNESFRSKPFELLTKKLMPICKQDGPRIYTPRKQTGDPDSTQTKRRKSEERGEDIRREKEKEKEKEKEQRDNARKQKQKEVEDIKYHNNRLLYEVQKLEKEKEESSGLVKEMKEEIRHLRTQLKRQAAPAVKLPPPTLLRPSPPTLSFDPKDREKIKELEFQLISQQAEILKLTSNPPPTPVPTPAPLSTPISSSGSENLRKQLKDISQLYMDAQDINRELEEKLEKTEEICEQMNKQLEQAQEQLKSISQLANDRDQLKKQLEKAENNALQFANNRDQLKKQLEKVENNALQLASDRDQLNQRLKNEESKTLQIENDFKQKNTDLEKKTELLKTENTTLQKTIDDTLKRLEVSNEELNELTLRNKDIQETNFFLQFQLDEKHNKFSTFLQTIGQVATDMGLCQSWSVDEKDSRTSASSPECQIDDDTKEGGRSGHSSLRESPHTEKDAEQPFVMFDDDVSISTKSKLDLSTYRETKNRSNRFDIFVVKPGCIKPSILLLRAIATDCPIVKQDWLDSPFSDFKNYIEPNYAEFKKSKSQLNGKTIKFSGTSSFDSDVWKVILGEEGLGMKIVTGRDVVGDYSFTLNGKANPEENVYNPTSFLKFFFEE